MGHRRTTELAYLDQLLEQCESADPISAIDAFNELCRLGCDREELGHLLHWYSLRSPIKLKSGTMIYLHSLDSWDSALDPNDGKEPITRQELVQIAERAKRLLIDINRLIRTPIVRQLVQQGEISPEDLLGGGPSAKTGVFQGLKRLPKVINQFGPRKKPDRSKLLARVCGYIRQSTGGYRDEILANILNALKPHDQDNPTTGPAIKQWRKRHGITDKARGTRTA